MSVVVLEDYMRPRTIATVAIATVLMMGAAVSLALMNKDPQAQEGLWPIALAGLFCSLILGALCAGLTTGLMSLDRGELEAEAANGNADAQLVLGLRQSTNLLVSTLVVANVFCMLATDQFVEVLMHGAPVILKWIVSLGLIVFFAEVLPIAALTRYGLSAGGLLAPAVLLLRAVFYPMAKPCAMVLDAWIGKEKLEGFGERNLKWLLEKQAQLPDTEVTRVEAIGAANFLTADDVPVVEEGEVVDPKSIVQIGVKDGGPDYVFDPASEASRNFLRQIASSGMSWVVLVDEAKQPLWVLDANAFLRRCCAAQEKVPIKPYCHKPIQLQHVDDTLEDVVSQFKVATANPHDDVIDNDVALVNIPGRPLRIITGADILGRLLRGIAARPNSSGNAAA
jgi:hypothetical protein